MPPNDANDIEAYLTSFVRAARRSAIKDAADIARDVRNHIEEALGAGEPWPGIRTKLGAPEALAKAYAVELMLGASDEPPRAGRADIPALLVLATGGGFLTLMATFILGAFSIAFGISAVLMFGLCLPIALGAPTPPHVHLGGLSPWIMVGMAPVMGVLAWGSFAALAAYLRWFARSLRRALPQRRT